MGGGQRQGGPRRDSRARAERQRLRLPRHDAGQRGDEGAREGGPQGVGHRPLGDQRGVRLGHPELDPAARDRRRPRQRQRRRGGARAPDRRLGRAHPRRAGPRAAPARRRLRLRGDLLGRRAGRRGHPEGVSSGPAGGHSAVFFDLDRTLMAGSPGFHWARAAQRAGLITRRRLAADAWENVKFRLRGSTDEATDAVRERVATMIAGQRVIDLGRLAPQVLAGVLPRLYPQMLVVAYEHQDAGRPVYICTAASQEMADLMAHVLQFEGAVGSRSEVVDGRYTGRPGGPFAYREGKAQLMRELAAEQGIDLEASYAYSDSESDLPMLRAVGHPVAVNPDSALARVARAEGWRIMRFDRLGPILKIGGAALAVALVGGGGGYAFARLRERLAPSRRSRLPRLRGASNQARGDPRPRPASSA